MIIWHLASEDADEEDEGELVGEQEEEDGSDDEPLTADSDEGEPRERPRRARPLLNRRSKEIVEAYLDTQSYFKYAYAANVMLGRGGAQVPSGDRARCVRVRGTLGRPRTRTTRRVPRQRGQGGQPLRRPRGRCAPPPRTRRPAAP